MNSVEWYYARDNQQTGPVSSAELKQLAAAGRLSPGDLVWREGMSEWAEARNVRGLFDGASAPAAVETQPVETAPQMPAAPMRHPFDALIDWFRPRCDVGRIDAISRFFRACGMYGLLAAMLLTVVFSVLMALEGDPVSALVSGVAFLVLLAALHYAAGKMCDSLDRLNAAAAESLPSEEFPRVLAMLNKALGVVALLGAIAAAAQASAFEPLPFGIAAFLALGFMSLTAASPAALYFTIGAEAGVAEQALGVITYLVKASARAAPAAFGAGVLCGTFWMGYACYLLALDGDNLSSIKFTTATACFTLVSAALLPLAAYITFLLYYFLRDLGLKVLELPAKFDESANAADNVDSAENTRDN
ncbi:MAG: DUF4339 domain-containing protein [Pirellulales bacterium]|nr:DUF4339 domain-containing protein [Pirellulales bacterium]